MAKKKGLDLFRKRLLAPFSQQSSLSLDQARESGSDFGVRAGMSIRPERKGSATGAEGP